VEKSYPYSQRLYTETQERYMQVLEDIDRLERNLARSSYEDEAISRRIADLNNEIRTLEDEIEPSFEYAD
jgi:septal ring factor EnvC (AmiA/AmiB activator)